MAMVLRDRRAAEVATLDRQSVRFPRFGRYRGRAGDTRSRWLPRQAPRAGDLLSPRASRYGLADLATLDSGAVACVTAHAARATFTWPCSCSSGTGSIWLRSPSSE